MATTATEAPKIAVHLLGEPALVRGNTPLSLPPSRKTRALFVYLLRNPRPQRRERLCEMFWDMPDDPRASLRWSLTKIRGMLGDCADWIVADRDRVQCVPHDIWVDLDALHVANDGAALARVELLRLADGAVEPPLLGLDLAGHDRYAAWLEAERTAAERLRCRLLKRAAALPDIEPERALRYYRAAVEACPDDSEAETGLRAAQARIGQGRIAAPSAAPVGVSALPTEQTIRYCSTPGGVKIAYACVGEGPPLVKAANWLNHLELDWRSPTWSRMFRDLSRDHHFIRYDERGNGLSDWNVADLSFDAFVRDLETVADTLELKRFPLLGISQGCAVSVEYAARHPERVSHLILYGGYAAGWRHTADPATVAEREAVITLVRHGWGQDNPAYRQIFSQTFMPSATAEELAWFNEFQRRTTSAENAVRFLEAFSRIDVRHRLKQVRAHTLIIHARGDQRIPMALGIELAAAIPNASLVTLDTDNHILLGREPAMDIFIDRIRRFLGVAGHSTG